MRKMLLAGVTTLALLAAPSSAARADITDGDLEDLFEPIEEALAELMEILLYIVEKGEMPGTIAKPHIDDIFGRVGRAPGSYLPDGADLEPLYPDDPMWVTVGDAKWYIHERLEDRKTRVEEAMDVSATVTRQMPESAIQLDTLAAANKVPVGMEATLQLGNEVNIESASILNRTAGMLAELGQLEADQRASEDWQRVMSFNWSEYHYQNAFWTGMQTWDSDSIDMGW